MKLDTDQINIRTVAEIIADLRKERPCKCGRPFIPESNYNGRGATRKCPDCLARAAMMRRI